jgi:putative ABC transport system ATP-binding protein
MKTFQDLNINEGITIVLVTHEADVASYARRIVHFRDGVIIGDGENARVRGVGAA